MIGSFESRPQPKIVFGAGSLARLGELARELGFQRTLLVADTGIVRAGYAPLAQRLLSRHGIDSWLFDGFDANPDSAMVEAGRAFAAAHNVDSIVAVGGGSSLDCAKGVNFVLTNGGRVNDYRGFGKAARPLLPSIGIPTTTGTGSEAQSYAVLSDAETHVKMACGDLKAMFRAVILDAELTLTQPAAVRAATGYDALSHAVETLVTTRRNALSLAYSREAWRLLSGSFEPFLAHPDRMEPAAAMQFGAFLAGAAIENSMLGATHACANPLTARFGTTHGVAIALLLPHVVRWNMPVAAGEYREWHPDLAARLEDLAVMAMLPRQLRSQGVTPEDLPCLADEAAQQWTGRFNPRPFDSQGALEVYRCAY